MLLNVILGVGREPHPLGDPVVLDVRLLDGTHHDAAVDGALGLQSPQDKDTHAGVELQLRARLNGQSDAGHDCQVRLDDVGAAWPVQQGQGVVEASSQVVQIDARRTVVD